MLRGDDIWITDKISLHHASLSEIVDIGEKEYYAVIASICATPSDYKSVLYDNFEIFWDEVGDFEFFMMMWGSLEPNNTKFVLPEIDVTKFKVVIDNEKQSVLLFDQENNIVIDEDVYTKISDCLRDIHGLSKKTDRAGNETTRKYLIKRDRKELEQARGKEYVSTLAPLISSMVNCEGFKYNHEEVWNLKIYQFMDSVRRIQKTKNIDHITQGIYAGTVDQSKISTDTLNWLGKLD